MFTSLLQLPTKGHMVRIFKHASPMAHERAMIHDTLKSYILSGSHIQCSGTSGVKPNSESDCPSSLFSPPFVFLFAYPRFKHDF